MDILRKMNAADLIKEVEKYPILYDNKYPNHTQQTSELKKKTWEVIAEQLCGERWKNFDELEHEAIAKEIQFKWKNLKDNFMRILKKEKDDEDNGTVLKRKKYVYYDILSFLRPFAPFAKKSLEVKEEVDIGGKNASNIIYINDDLENDTLLQVSSPSPIAPKPTKVPPPIAPMSSFGTLQPVQLIQLQPNALGQNATKDDVTETANLKLAQVLEQIAQEREEEKMDDQMGNKKFLMSLVPFMQKLADDVNLEVRLQIMSILQHYTVKDVS